MKACSTMRSAFGALLAAGLTACGGGGGDSGPVASTADFPVAAAVNAYSQAAHQYAMAGTLDGVAFTLDYTYAPGAAATFEGRSVATATATTSLKANGTLAAQQTMVTYFGLNPFVPYGSTDPDTGSYGVTTLTAAFPTTARVGQSGALATEVEYASSAKTQVTDTSSVSWSLEADSASTALFCLNTVFTGSVSGNGSECYRVDTAGTVLGLIVKVTVNGKTLVLK